MTDQEGRTMQTPYKMRGLGSEDFALIEEETVRLVEHKRLGTSTTEMNIKDIVFIDRRPQEEGEILILRRRVGNPMHIGPLDSEVAAAGVGLLESLMETQ